MSPADHPALETLLDTQRFSGVILVRQNGRDLLRLARDPIGLDGALHAGSRLHVGSLTKQFTAAAVLQLVDSGRLALDACINDYLSEAMRGKHWLNVTVRHLLTHSSGIPDYAAIRDYYAVDDGWAFGSTKDGMIDEAKSRPLAFPAGSQFRYANIGYTLLGEMLERIYDSTFAEIIAQRLLAPMHMHDSAIHDLAYQHHAEDSLGLRWDIAAKRHVRDDVISLPVTPPDGGLVTTLNDFDKWIEIFRTRGSVILSPRAVETMLGSAGTSTGYRWPEHALQGPPYPGLGVMRSGDLVMHEGSIVGYRSFFMYGLSQDLLVAVFANNTYSAVFRIAAFLLANHGAL